MFIQTPCYFQSFPDLQKLAVQTLPLSNLFQTIPLRGCHSYHKVNCHTKIPVYICFVMVMITKHVRCNVLTAKSINNFKHRNNYPFIEVGYFSSHFSIKQCKMPDFCIVFITDSPERERKLKLFAELRFLCYYSLISYRIKYT